MTGIIAVSILKAHEDHVGDQIISNIVILVMKGYQRVLQHG